MKIFFKRLTTLLIVIAIFFVFGCGSGDEKGPCAVPQISPTPVKTNSEQIITITCVTDGATIRYTTDNTDPSETAGTIIASGGSFTLSSTSTVKAIAYKPGRVTSTITSIKYVFQQWTWVSGDSNESPFGEYGTKGSGSTFNMPGSREGGSSWIDSSGNFWLFGGDGVDGYGNRGCLDDLWKFDPSNGEWTWVSGDNAVNEAGVYGTKGIGSASNKPGARNGAVSWVDSSGNLWLFGGAGYDAYGNFGHLNDLWKVEPSTGEWTWVSGDNAYKQFGVYGTKGTGSASNTPGARSSSVSWIDKSGNLWLFGGVWYYTSEVWGEYNDLWKFEPSTGEWTWVSGDNTLDQAGEYGTKGIGSTSSKPGARESSSSMTDSSGNFWLFGGVGTDSSGMKGLLNDLWKFEPSTGEWTWVSGDNINSQICEYGTKGTGNIANKPGARMGVISWIDSSGDLWFFGGWGVDSTLSARTFNDLWRFDPSTGEWTWVCGDNIENKFGIYGTKGMGSTINKPGARDCGLSWTDSSGNLWLFGGSGYDAGYDGYSNYTVLNDLWKFEP
jgi:N-acetylneuraminic acid mutarotase